MVIWRTRRWGGGREGSLPLGSSPVCFRKRPGESTAFASAVAPGTRRTPILRSYCGPAGIPEEELRKFQVSVSGTLRASLARCGQCESEAH